MLDWLLDHLTTGWRWGRWRMAALAVTGVAWATPVLGYAPWPAYWQTGDSLPKGLYALQPGAPIERGAIVVLRDPPHFYLPWLMKRVEGMPGDLYCWDEAAGTHRLNGRPMPPPSPAALAMGLEPWRGCRRLAEGEIVGYGDSPDSYDSRYAPLGPVAMARLAGRYALVLARE